MKIQVSQDISMMFMYLCSMNKIHSAKWRNTFSIINWYASMSNNELNDLLFSAWRFTNLSVAHYEPHQTPCLVCEWWLRYNSTGLGYLKEIYFLDSIVGNHHVLMNLMLIIDGFNVQTHRSWLYNCLCYNFIILGV